MAGSVRFHTLKTSGGTARLRHACRLAEEALLAGERVLVWLQDAAELEQFDNLLWTFSDRAFVPHEMLGSDPAACETPVQLHAGTGLDERALGGSFGTLLTLRETASPEMLRFARVIEVLDADPTCRNAGRARFRFYREQGVTPEHVEVTEDG
jgi:DNA polymerase-3 subunit chi